MLSRYTSETWQLIGDKMQALSVYKFMHAGTCALKRAHTHTHTRARARALRSVVTERLVLSGVMNTLNWNL